MQSMIHACHEQIKFLSSQPAYLLAFKEKNSKNSNWYYSATKRNGTVAVCRDGDEPRDCQMV